MSHFVVQAEAGLRERTHLRVRDGDMRRMRRIAPERDFALKGRIEHRICVRARKALDPDRDIDEPWYLPLQALETFLDAAFYSLLVGDFVLQLPQKALSSHPLP